MSSNVDDVKVTKLGRKRGYPQQSGSGSQHKADWNSSTQPKSPIPRKKMKATSEPIEPKPAAVNVSSPTKSKIMHNTHIMAKVSELMPAKILFDLRETCTMWNTNFVPQIEKKHTPLHLAVVTNEYYNFPDLLRSSSNFPFSRYQFHPYKDDVTPQHDFIKKFGNKITSIECKLYWVQSDSRRQPRDLPTSGLRKKIFELVPTVVTDLTLLANLLSVEIAESSARVMAELPTLKRLKVTENAGFRNSAFVQFVSDVVQCATGLESAEIFDPGYSQNNVGNGLLQSFITALRKTPGRYNVQLCNLKTLKLSRLQPAHLRILIQLTERRHENALRLDSFSLTVYCQVKFGGPQDEDEAVSLLHRFLSRQSTSLKYLGVLVPIGNDRLLQPSINPVQIPRLENLKEFKAEDIELSIKAVQFDGAEGSRKFRDTFPNLRQFSSNFSWSNEMERLFHPGVVELRGLCAHSSFAQFRNIFPWLTRLELAMSYELSSETYDCKMNGLINIFWTSWPHLTVLKVLRGTMGFPNVAFDLDPFISGVSPRSLAHLRQEIAEHSNSAVTPTLTVESLRTTLNKYKTLPGISDLKHLQHFELQLSDNPRLTDIGGYFGLALASPHLQRVFIPMSKENLLSENCRAFLINTFGPCALINA